MAIRPVGCPTCHAPLNSAEGLWGHVPQPGDVALCLFCESVLQIQPDMSLAAFDVSSLSAEEQRELRGLQDRLRGMLPEEKEPN